MESTIVAIACSETCTWLEGCIASASLIRASQRLLRAIEDNGQGGRAGQGFRRVPGWKDILDGFYTGVSTFSPISSLAKVFLFILMRCAIFILEER